jgi:hypothetical protein
VQLEAVFDSVTDYDTEALGMFEALQGLSLLGVNGVDMPHLRHLLGAYAVDGQDTRISE